MHKQFQDCFVKLDGESLVIGNSRIQRKWILQRDRFSTASIDTLETSLVSPVVERPSYDFQYEGLTARRVGREMRHSALQLTSARSWTRRNSPIGSPRLSVCLVFEDPWQGLSVRWWARVMPRVGALSVQCEIRSENAPLGDYNRADFSNVIDNIPLPADVQGVESVLFRARSDRTNELVEVHRCSMKDLETVGALGNIVYLLTKSGRGLFVLHDGPCREDRRQETDVDFRVHSGTLQCLGWGIRPEDIRHNQYRCSCSVTIGSFDGGRSEGEAALKSFLRVRYPRLGVRRPVIIANPWGDRQWYEHAHAAFVHEELDACSEIGITDYQLDDGWQAGGTLQDLSANKVITDDYWKCHPKNFPGGFKALRNRSEQTGVRLALWYAADSNRNYRQWADDVKRLSKLHRIGKFERIKIDMMRTRTKDAEDNLFRLLAAVRREDPNIVFDLDVTGAVQRPGYFLLQDYGDIFVENRYTASGNYFPSTAARNFWNLAHHLPLQRLEMEFLNPRLNKGKYASDDDLAPGNYEIGYLFAMTFFAIPLCWCEPSSLSQADRARLKPLIAFRRQLHERIQNSLVYPIGEEPNGKTWFGFLAMEDDGQSALLSVFRDRLAPEETEFDLPVKGLNQASFVRLAGSVQIADVSKMLLRGNRPGSFGIFSVRM